MEIEELKEIYDKTQNEINILKSTLQDIGELFEDSYIIGLADTTYTIALDSEGNSQINSTLDPQTFTITEATKIINQRLKGSVWNNPLDYMCYTWIEWHKFAIRRKKELLSEINTDLKLRKEKE